MDIELTDSSATLRQLYLDLLKKALTHSLWVERTQLIDPSRLPRSWKRYLVANVVGALRPFRLRLARERHQNPTLREMGEDWPEFAHTMIGMKRLENIQYCIETILRDGVEGDLIETGVWRGGAVIFMRGILKAYEATGRTIWAADSFEGLPPPDPSQFPADKDDICYQRDFTAVSLEEVKANFTAFGLLDDSVKFLKGWFKDTLESAPISKLALMRLDGDMYQSTIEALSALYPRLAVGGFVIIDDYAAAPCRQAVSDYRGQLDIKDEIVRIDNWGTYWRRTR